MVWTFSQQLQELRKNDKTFKQDKMRPTLHNYHLKPKPTGPNVYN